VRHIEGIFAGFEFYDEKKHLIISQQVSDKGIDAVLTEICGLRPEEAIYDLLRKEYLIRTAGE